MRAFLYGLGMSIGVVSCSFTDPKEKTNDKVMPLIDTVFSTNTVAYSAQDSAIIRFLHKKLLNMKALKEKMQAGEKVKIVCFGNSITYGFRVSPIGQVDKPYPQTLEILLRNKYKNTQIEVINEGHNGWRSDQAAQQVQRLVVVKNPDLVIVKFGINDAYSSFPLPFYKRNITSLVKQLKENRMHVLLLSPTPISTPQNALVSQYSTVLRQVAQEQGVSFLDMHQIMTERMKASNLPEDVLLPDQVHLGSPYYKWIAEEIAYFWEAQ